MEQTMTPKEIIEKNYECFNTGDMETFVSLYHDDVVVTINGMHRFSGVHKGMAAWMEVLGSIPPRYEEFSVTPVNMIAEGDQVFTQIHAKAKGLDADFGHYHKLVDGKIKEFWIYDDSQKMAHVMKAI
jgi:ketosteroid isomerase-like protein